jgi:hypothetical protein
MLIDALHDVDLYHDYQLVQNAKCKQDTFIDFAL